MYVVEDGYGGGGNEPMLLTYSIGGGQIAEVEHMSEEVCQTLNCMHNLRGIVQMEKNTCDKEPIAVLDMQGGKIGAHFQMPPETTPALTRGRGSADDVHSVAYRYAVRRITPIEGERLQGFADNWTRPCFKPEDITDELVDRFIGIHQHWSETNGKADAKPKTREWVRKWLTNISSQECPDGPRYKAIGNSMSTNVMLWIGMRIELAEMVA